MRIALTFLTCERADLTRKTLNTLAAHNDLGRFILLHGDDASKDDEGGALARSMGFRTVVQTRGKRAGVAKMTADLFVKAAQAGADVVLNLQNDWECVRPIPTAEIEVILQDQEIYNVRLYGAMKSTTGRCGIHHGGREPRQVVEWREYAPGYEVGDIHWGHPPCVTRIDQALRLTVGARNEAETRRRSGKIRELTARTVNNVFLHIGRERTPGFVA